MEKLTGAMNPQFEDETPFDPFDLWTGANFKLKIRKVDGYQNYDVSEFDTPGPLKDDDDDQLKVIWEAEHSLSEVISEKNFKTYDELKAKLDRVLGVTSPTVSRSNTMEAVKQQKIQNKEEEIDRVFTNSSADEDDSDLDYFSKLLDEEEE